MISLILMNIIVLASAGLLAFKWLAIDNFIDKVISVFILYFSQIVLTELVLGVFGILYLNQVIILNFIVFLVICACFRKKQIAFKISGFSASVAGLLNNKIVLLFICIILGFALPKIIINLVNPPFGWDDLNYHFTFPVEWLKHGNFNTPITIFDDPSPSYYPINGSLYFLWLMLPLRNVFMADLGQIPFFILAFLAVFSISRKLKLNREEAFCCAALFFIIPNFFKQIQVAYVDVMVAALFLACVNFLFLLSKKFAWQNVLIYSLSLGLLLGTKTIALTYCVLLLLPFTFLLIKNIKKFYLLIILIFAVFALGCFSYVRNFIETGNPLYPLDFKLFGQTVFKGVMDSYVYRAHFKLEDYRLGKVLFHEGLGLQTVIFVLIGMFLGLPVALLKKRREFDFNLIYFFILPILLYLDYRYIIPLANLRYLYPLLGIGVVIGLYTFKALDIPEKIVNILAVVCAIASMAELAKRQELICAVIITTMLFFLLKSLSKYTKGLILKPAFILALGISIIFLITFLNYDYNRNEYTRYSKMVKYSGFWPDAAKAWEWLNKNTAGNNIAYIGRPVAFPLYGSNFKNNVYYVSVNSTEPVRLHYLPKSHYAWGYDFLSLHKNLEDDVNYRGRADYSVWLKNLLERNTDFLFIYSLHQTKDTIFPLEDMWARGNQGKFNPVFTNETIHIYRLIK